MKVVIVGGAGRVGRRIAERLLARDVGQVTLADRKAPIGGAAAFTEIDIESETSLHAIFTEHDLVINTVGPFDRWGTTVLDAAITAGTDYIDICDDPAPTLQMLERNDRAAESDVRAVVGLGASPGLPNLLMLVAARELEEVNTLCSYWGDSAEGLTQAEAITLAARVVKSFREGRAVWIHMLEQTGGTIPVWRDGESVQETPLGSRYRITLAAGETGSFPLMGHPEAITVPRVVAVREAMCIGTLGAGLDRLLADAQSYIAGGAAPKWALARIADHVERDPASLMTPALGPPLPTQIGAVAVGRMGGEVRSVVAMPGGPTDGSMSIETGRVAACGVELMDEVPPGVHPPESAFDPDRFLTAFSAREWGDEAPAYRLSARPGKALVGVSV